jgi:hypothetical protein
MFPPRVHYSVGIFLTLSCTALSLFLLHRSDKYTFFSWASRSFAANNTTTTTTISFLLKDLAVTWHVFLLWFAIATAIRYFTHMNPGQVTRRHPVELDARLFKSATEIARDLRQGKYSSVEITTLFIEHIKNTDRFHINAIVFERFELALQEAARADAKLQKNLLNNNKKPRNNKNDDDDGESQEQGQEAEEGEGEWLLGCPCLVKECFAVENCSNCVGHPKRVGTLATEDAPVVARLRRAGAIVMALTNTSELCMWLESSNHVFSATCNPYDASRIVGGSSGGECAAISSFYGAFGVTSDIGGSTRKRALKQGDVVRVTGRRGLERVR